MNEYFTSFLLQRIPSLFCNYSAALYLRLLNSHLIGFLALAKERVRLLPFGWHPVTQLLGAHLNSYKEAK
ncbi:MAG: hypothetical protein KZQ63_16825 [Candidatus Thiodiazotropha sp. (ex Lucinoma aequizonata)]|nr:hypothetical protein [Candidatus Thiodiazotropha sp. (ex Lucinoma aequizonata)]